jgi:membrane protein YqaA with SNARE-associated domain
LLLSFLSPTLLPRQAQIKVMAKKKKPWTRPAFHVLSINKGTFSGSLVGFEVTGKSGPPAKT